LNWIGASTGPVETQLQTTTAAAAQEAKAEHFRPILLRLHTLLQQLLKQQMRLLLLRHITMAATH
jgi:hypothetical protein